MTERPRCYCGCVLTVMPILTAMDDLRYMCILGLVQMLMRRPWHHVRYRRERVAIELFTSRSNSGQVLRAIWSYIVGWLRLRKDTIGVARRLRQPRQAICTRKYTKELCETTLITLLTWQQEQTSFVDPQVYLVEQCKASKMDMITYVYN